MPLTFDLSMDELMTYEGRNPRPADFDRFWDDSVAEMRALDPALEWVPSEFQTPTLECLHAYFTGVGDARIHAKVIRPREMSGPRPAVIRFHGYTISSGEWCDHLALASLGYTVAALDCRGQGGESQDVGGVSGNTYHGQIIRGLDDPPAKLLFRQIFLDAAQLAGIVMTLDNVDETRVGATGGSQGGGLTLACAALEPRIRLAAPVYPFLSDYRRGWEMDLAKCAYSELAAYFRAFDPTHAREDAIFEKLGYIDVQHLCPRIQAEVYMGIGLQDETCPPSTQFAAYNKISAPKSLEIYPDYAHERLLGHDDRVFQFLSRLATDE